MADIRCLICNRVNDSSAERCWYCNTRLPGTTGSLTRQEREKLASINRNLSSTENGESGESSAEEQAVAEPPQTPEPEEIPEWLAHIRELKKQDQQTGNAEPRDWVQDEDPEWLHKLAAGDQEPESDVGDVASIEESLGVDETLSGSAGHNDQSAESSEELSPDFFENPEVTPFKGDIFAEEEEEKELEPGPSADWSFLTGETADINAEDTAQKAQDEQGIPLPTQEPEVPFPLAMGDLPDWLANEQPVEEQDAEEELEGDQAIQQPEKPLEKANMPAWITALRPKPVKSQAETPTETQAETPLDMTENPIPELSGQGVLAGIQGTLPAMNLPDRVEAPRRFGEELHASPAQLKNSELFRTLLQPAEDRAVGPGEKPTSVGESKLLRLLVTLLLLASVIIPLIFSGAQGVMPTLFSQEVVNMLNVINRLPTDKPVLVAAHFEAGLAGELNWTAQPVLKHLVSRRIPMVLTSTNVVGFAVLQQLIAQAVGEDADYKLTKNVVDLGYLPGGTIGLGALVNDPLSALPFTTDIQPVDEVKILNGISSLSDFGGLILVTDNPDVARYWVEQMAQADTSLTTVAIISAQAAPMVLPYFYSGQVNGFVSGLGGALSYELLRTAPGIASSRFNALQVILLVAAIVILFGGIFATIIGANTRTRERKNADAK